MAATKVQFNWGNVSFTPTGGSAIIFNKVTGVNIDPGGNIATFSGDNDRFPTLAINDFNTPSVSVQGADIGTFQGIPPGTTGQFTATHLDAKAATGGNIVYVFSNAVVRNNPSQGAHRQFGGGTFDMIAFSSDGVTNPLSFTRA